MSADLLPDVPGCVHGIVSLDPPTIQCDGCGKTYSRPGLLSWAIILSGITFDPRLGYDGGRLCRDCGKAAGRTDR